MEQLLGNLRAGERRIDQIVEFARSHLSLDVFYVSEFTDGKQVYRAIAGDAASFQIQADGALPMESTYDRLMLSGYIPNVICDTAADGRVADLAVTRSAGVGSYVGIPIRCLDGKLYGTLSGAGHLPDQTLDERAVRVLSMLGELIVHDVDEARGRDQLQRDIQALIEEDGFDVAYQPIFDLTSGRCVGLEALARFPEPFGGPDQTFAAAEAVGLRGALEDAAARRAFEIVPQLASGQYLAINASPTTLLRLARQVSRDATPLLSRVVVEVTEDSVPEGDAALREELTPLREQGLRIAVDDVGAGYASLRRILELRPDFVKLDRWLVEGLADDRGRRVAVSAFASMARELGSSVIAEGVQRQEDLAAVMELGLDAAQGYLLGRPSTDRHEVAGWCSPPGPAGVAAPAAADVAVALVRDESNVAEWFSSANAVTARERNALDRELERWQLDRRVSQHLEAVGQLAAGIAHEINTPLQFVGDSVTFLTDAVDELTKLTGLYRETLYADTQIPLEERRQAMREAEERADVEYLCERIPAAFDRTLDGISRVREIVQAMKRFSHASGTESAPADINEAIETTLAVCRNEYKYVAEIHLDLADLPAVVCNVGELNQVFLNLIINAAQAIEEQIAGTDRLGQIRISSRLAGDAVVIQVADDGPGIPLALQDRIFEPFFTTKEIGKGTGQGLALALATIQRHAGSLECNSVPGQGTTFSIRLPVDGSAVAAEMAA